MRALVNHAQSAHWAEQGLAHIAAVISNEPQAAGLAFAQQVGIATEVVPHRLFPNRDSFDVALMEVIDRYEPDLVLLAGFMRILTPSFVTHYADRLINIHPSILPNFKGLHTHQAALDAGVKVHGATVHMVTAELDHGAYIMQSCVEVKNDDTAESLAARVLQTEHIIYPQVLDWYVNDQLVMAAGKVSLTNGASQVYMLSPHTL